MLKIALITTITILLSYSAYGVAARAAGIDPLTAIMGAGAFGWINISRMDPYNILGLGDTVRDTEMILKGYFR